MKIVYTNQFIKDFKKIKSQDKDIDKLKTVINLLFDKEKLDSKYKDHKLTGKYKQFRDCHIEPDWILIYKTTTDVLTLYRTGSHSELFE